MYGLLQLSHLDDIIKEADRLTGQSECRFYKSQLISIYDEQVLLLYCTLFWSCAKKEIQIIKKEKRSTFYVRLLVYMNSSSNTAKLST